MNWPKELIIKRDATNTKVANINNIISYIGRCYDLDILTNYLSQLKNQTKLDMEEVSSIIEATEYRIKKINSFLEEYENCKNDEELLINFYEYNYKFIEGLINFYKIDKGEIDYANVS